MIRIGTRDSELALWQAGLVKEKLAQAGFEAELVHIKTDGDIDLVTPLYALGVQGVFTRALDAALLSNKIDLAVHSMKDVPVQMAQGIAEAAVLERASHLDIFVPRQDAGFLADLQSAATIATSSIRRRAQWLHRYPRHQIENLRGNVNTRLRKVAENDWAGAIFAAAGLERIRLRPASAVDLDWMLPAPAQGAVLVVCREGDARMMAACGNFHHPPTADAVKLERDFLKELMGGCATPISALATPAANGFHFKGNIAAPDGSALVAHEQFFAADTLHVAGALAAKALCDKGGAAILQRLNNHG